MERKNTILLTVIAVATLLVAVVGATFAYFASAPTTGDGLEFTATTQPASAAFTANAGTLSLEITADEMLRAQAGDGVVADSATTSTDGNDLVVDFKSAANGTEMSCTYDIVYTWTSEGEHIYSAHTQGVTGNEFTIQATVAHTGAGAQNAKTAEGNNVIKTEKDWTDLSWETDEETDDRYTTIVTGASIFSSSAETSTVSTWTFTTKFYNRNADQTGLAAKNFAGVFTVDNVIC